MDTVDWHPLFFSGCPGRGRILHVLPVASLAAPLPLQPTQQADALSVTACTDSERLPSVGTPQASFPSPPFVSAPAPRRAEPQLYCAAAAAGAAASFRCDAAAESAETYVRPAVPATRTPRAFLSSAPLVSLPAPRCAKLQLACAVAAAKAAALFRCGAVSAETCARPAVSATRPR